MIIFGTKAKYNKVAEGDFYCPRCQAQRHYIHKKAQRYFSLYFIPIIPIGDLGEFVECQTCHTAFETVVLSMKTPPPRPMPLAEMLNNIPRFLQAGKPVEYLVRDLTAAGLERDLASKTVANYLPDTPKVCETCALTYHPVVRQCDSCGKPLG